MRNFKICIQIILCLISVLNSKAQTGNIYGGTPIDIIEAPWQVSVERNGSHWCGGSIINSEWIVTAAHCYSGFSGTFTVHAGATDQTNNSIGQRITVDQIIIHPNYLSSGGFLFGNDIALLHLSSPLCFNENVQPVVYAETGTALTVGMTALISGWGDSGQGCCNGVLLGASLPLISDADATTMIADPVNGCDPTNFSIGATTLAFYQQGIAAGPGDSGGPAVITINGTPTLVGASSWGGCPRDDYPTMYADVGSLSGFIDGNITSSECSNTCDFELDSISLVLTTNQTFGGNIVVKAGSTLTIDGATVLFGQERSLTIENGGKVVLRNNATLNKCSDADYWNGVLVHSGGEFDAKESNIYNAKIGVRGNQNSTLTLDVVKIIGLNNAFGQGIYIEHGVNALKLNRLKIENYERGIDAWWGDVTYEVTNSEINNVNIGVLMVENTLLLTNSYITKANWGVYLWKSLGSIIQANQIGFLDHGIRCYRSPYTSIAFNTIGWNTQRGRTGIYLNQSGGGAISNNTQIEATNLGISLFRSETLVDHNTVNIFGQNNQFGGGIQNFDFPSQIINNYLDINHSSFGIETVNSTGSSITNNQIDHFSTVSTRTAAIRSMGSMDELIEENVIVGVANTTGMIVQNTMGNHYECNITNNTAEGLSVFFNSDEQEIKANEFDAGIDLAIRSIVGLQPHHGNKFMGGSVRANELSFDDRQLSQFKANTNIPDLWPSDIVPDDGSWWKGEPNLNHYTCDGSYGPGWVPFGNDPDKLCAYWTYLKSIKTRSPKTFFIKLYHLLKYYKGTKNGLNLPNCIKLDPVYQSVCGLVKLVDVSVAMDSIGKVTTTSTLITNLQTQYNAEITESGKIQKKEQLAAELSIVRTSIDIDQQQDSIALDNIETELNSIDCAEIIVMKWKEIYQLYIKFLRQGLVAQDDKSKVLTYSTECSDEYGDVIHLARAMANTFDDTYFDSYDGCLHSSGPRSQSKADIREIIDIYPNPSLGQLYLQLPAHYYGQAEVYSPDGRLISSTSIIDSNLSMIEISELGGVYYIHLKSKDGDVVTKKVIVIK